MKINKLIKFLSFTIFIFLFVSLVNAKEDNELKIEHTIDSKFPAEKRIITVQLPESYKEQNSHKYPVLYLLDGQSNLGFSKSIVDFLTESGTMPEVIIVAMHSNENRSRDYLPQNAEKRFSGNASQYLKHLEQELIPFVEKNYRAASFRVLSGHSYGGVFVTHAMLEKPNLFKAYITQSPFFSKQIGGPLVERLTKFLAENPKLEISYYMNIGTEPRLEQNFKKVKILFETTSPKTFVWNAEFFPQKTHMTTLFIGQYNALEDIFVKDWTFSPQEIAKGNFADFKSKIDNLSKKYGAPAIISQRHFVQATQAFLSKQNQESAIKTAELFTNRYPDSPLSHFFLAVGYGQKYKEKAKTAIEKAIKLFEAAPEPKSKTIYQQMKQVQKQLTSQ